MSTVEELERRIEALEKLMDNHTHGYRAVQNKSGNASWRRTNSIQSEKIHATDAWDE